MLRKGTALLLLVACAAHADTNSQANNPETVAERSQATARAVLDKAVAAIGGAEALRSIDVVRPAARRRDLAAAADANRVRAVRSRHAAEELLLDLKNNRMKLWQKGSGAGLRRATTPS
jgi:hypothetical protein